MIALVSAINRNKQLERRNLVESITQLEKQYNKTNRKKTYHKLLSERRKLEIIDSEGIQTKLLYLKQKTWMATPKALKILAFRTRAKLDSRFISRMKDNRGEICSDSKDILKIFSDFYSSLYSSKPPDKADIDKFLKQCNLPEFKEEHKFILEKEFTQDEMLEAIKSLKTNKSPGLDGYTAENYKCFAHILLTPLTETCNQVRQTGILPPSWKQATITVILKPGKDLLSPKIL